MADKKGETWYLQSEFDLAVAMLELGKLKPTKDAPVKLKWSFDSESRSLKQNRLAFAWYKFRGEATGHGKEYERAVCKLLYGIPILREDEKFNAFYTVAVDRLNYEQKMAAMEYVPVTSLMKVRQFAEYLTTVDNETASIGIVLPRPEDLYYDALMLDRRAL